MKVFTHKGLAVVIMLRDEHCPPHVHVDGDDWAARFRFSFWHAGVELWDVVPYGQRPPLAVLEGVRKALQQPAHLRKARSVWWSKLHTVCVDHQLWDWQASAVVDKSSSGRQVHLIESAYYAIEQNSTLLKLVGAPYNVEISL